jgi:hypothetical protein
MNPIVYLLCAALYVALGYLTCARLLDDANQQYRQNMGIEYAACIFGGLMWPLVWGALVYVWIMQLDYSDIDGDQEL